MLGSKTELFDLLFVAVFRRLPMSSIAVVFVLAIAVFASIILVHVKVCQVGFEVQGVVFRGLGVVSQSDVLVNLVLEKENI